MKRSILFLIGFVLMTGPVLFAQKSEKNKPNPRFIRESSGSNRNQARSVFQKHFSLRAEDDLKSDKSETDELGFTHDKYQQYYKGVKVEGAVYTVHSRKNVIESLSGEYKSLDSIDVTPKITAVAALDAAMKKINAKLYAWDPTVIKGYNGYSKPVGELVIIGGSEGDKMGPRLAWKLDVYAVEPLYRAWVFVDAITGQVLFENQRIHTINAPSSGTSLFNGTVSFSADNTGTSYRLRQTVNGNGIETYNLNRGTNYAAATDFTSATSLFTGDSTGVQAHWGAEQTYTYYKNTHNRNSFDNAGAVIKSYVHYSTNYVNAFWDGTQMTYGDGDPAQGYRPLVSLDICGHEITHGVTQYAANLTYSNESGALNESFSDIFGEAIENFAKGSNDWMMSCDIGMNGCGAFRNMANPNQFADPDTYKGTNWYAGTLDNGGVHTNSGVQNKWFYILTAGESGTNDLGAAYTVTGIGILKAAKIAYRNLTVYLTASSGYVQARAGAIQAAIDLYGAGSPEEIATTNAWYAVGVGCQYGVVCYCSSSGASQADEWIKSVQIGTFTNASAASSYTYFSNLNIPFTAGSTYNLTLTPGFSLITYGEYWRIWIDYNKDNDFDDAGELVYDAGATSTTTKTGTMTIAAGSSGTTRMRVSMKYGAAPTQCEGFAYGEVEDYPITISAAVPDTQAPTAPVLTAPSKTTTSINLSWTAATDNIGVTGYDVYVNSVKNNAANITGLTYTISGLTSGATYSILVRAKDLAGNSTASNTLSVTTSVVVVTDTLLKGYYFPANLESWVASNTTNCKWLNNTTRAYEGVGSIQLQASGTTATSPTISLSGYSQVELKFFFSTAGIEAGKSFNVRYSTNNGSTYTTLGTFTSAATAGTSSFVSNGGFYSVTVTINSTTFTANSRFRFTSNGANATDQVFIDAVTVRGRKNTTGTGTTVVLAATTKPVTNEAFSFGRITNEAAFSVYPNPVSDRLYISAPSPIRQIRLLNSNGALVKNFSPMGNNSLDVSGLSKGIYIAEVVTTEGIVRKKFVRQ